MKSVILGTLIAITATALPAMAEAEKFVVFSISAKKPAVKVTSLVGGYSDAEIRKFIAAHCAGSVGALEASGKPRKKRGKLMQKYVTTCQGGPNPKLFATNNLTVEVEPTTGRKNMFEYTFFQSGNMMYERIER
ncbi:MAG: hypothetical protein K8F59_09490 [Rhodobacteraceae bacterium]|nr:hypothetical protein [Paracoccaceae bacterium]